ncbi:TIGR02444 family protein [Marinobacterium jannaschii]|uniref:TIGR02444 family protein n=1 Tax=Marinobacterium jannaschii TaxID=64970 RepID=UPI00068495BA|nr:TIGR02444 family protein [Marinobacterium jannaschii]
MQLQNALWDYALDLYARPGVTAACLSLQQQGLSINRLLFCCWLGEQGRLLQGACGADALHWQQQITHPLRALRYQVRARQQDEGYQPCYKALRQAELACEQVELALLHASAEALPIQPGIGLAAKNIKNYLCDAGIPMDHAMLADIKVVLNAADAVPENWPDALNAAGK